MRFPRAFTLVEVVMALAIFSFAIIALVGLMSAGLRNGRESGADLALGLMTQTVASTLHGDSFGPVQLDPRFGNDSPDFFFDSDGKLIVDGSGVPASSPSAQGLYACTVKRSAPANLNTTNTVLLRMEFSWPLTAPEANRQKKAILTSLANHD